jgi:hypothetical protein
MANDMKQFEKEFSRIAPLFWTIDWATNPASYTPDKAKVCAVFAKIAYLKIPDFELVHHSLAKIIPCWTYQQAIQQSWNINLLPALQGIEVGDNGVFVVQTSYAVAVGIITPRVIIIALRGTRLLSLDWFIDFDVRWVDVFPNNHGVTFHQGFYLAITECLAGITSEITRRTKTLGKLLPIYVVGHSLGGAMAGIMHALGGVTFASRFRYETLGVPIMATDASFTFGMPRYGDLRAITKLRTPIHIYNDNDPVPDLMPMKLGYVNVPVEYRVDANHSVVRQSQTNQGSSFCDSLDGLRKEHPIENYIQRLL